MMYVAIQLDNGKGCAISYSHDCSIGAHVPLQFLYKRRFCMDKIFAYQEKCCFLQITHASREKHDCMARGNSSHALAAPWPCRYIFSTCTHAIRDKNANVMGHQPRVPLDWRPRHPGFLHISLGHVPPWGCFFSQMCPCRHALKLFSSLYLLVVLPRTQQSEVIPNKWIVFFGLVVSFLWLSVEPS